MKIVSSEFEHGRVYFKQFGAERVKQFIQFLICTNIFKNTKQIKGLRNFQMRLSFYFFSFITFVE